ncbi:MAG TPA: hypothetical protein VGR32_01180 [Brevundimonas sp.]|uniref:ImuA family protein n=1 Tax=Brevundimonas sp. TaxID=1871086 RepID=UPI002DE4279F|nr:hypothetical protein [Brevundimonas sp.]
MKNIKGRSDLVGALRTRLSGCGTLRAPTRGEAGRAGLPLASARRGLHDVYAATSADSASTNAFALGLGVGAAGGRPVVWALQHMADQESGRPYGPGLHQMGFRPRDLLLVRVRDAAALLAVGEEALRSPAVGAVVLTAWGEARAFTLTASRRLAMAARAGGGSVFLVRAAADPAPSAAETRWSVRAVASSPLEAGAPGRPAFSATLLRSRGGEATRTWTMEWDRERRVFVEPAPLSGGLVPLAAQRQAGARDGDMRHVA